MASSRSSGVSEEVLDSYNTSITSTLGSNSLGINLAGRGANSGSSFGDIINFSDAFKSQDVYNSVANLGAGGSATGSPSQSQTASGGDVLKNALPWIMIGVAAFFAYLIIKK